MKRPNKLDYIILKIFRLWWSPILRKNPRMDLWTATWMREGVNKYGLEHPHLKNELRAAFEAHCLIARPYLDLTRDNLGRFQIYPIESMWEIWNAAQPALKVIGYVDPAHLPFQTGDKAEAVYMETEEGFGGCTVAVYIKDA